VEIVDVDLSKWKWVLSSTEIGSQVDSQTEDDCSNNKKASHEQSSAYECSVYTELIACENSRYRKV